MGSEPTAPERPETISQWITAARAGSDAALGHLLETCQRYLMQVANGEMESRLQAKIGASDIVQETYIEAQRIFNRFQGSSPVELRAWLRAILLNKLATAARQYHATAKRQLGREVPIDPSPSQAIDPAASMPTASSIMVREERMQSLMTAMGRLPDDYRQVILWRQVENLGFEEMAQRLGRSIDAVRKLWWRALQALQQELGEKL